MKCKKCEKILSLILAMIMLFSCMGITAYAEEKDLSFDISKIQKYNETNHAIEANQVTSANAGDVIVLTFALKNNTSSKISVGSYEAYLTYDATVLSPYVDTAAKEDEIGPFWKSWSKVLVSDSTSANGANTPGLIKLTLASADGVSVKKNSTTEFCQIALKVANDAESTELKFGFDTTANNAVNNVDTAAVATDITATNTLSVTGVTPTLSTVALANTTVTVNGTDEQSVQATATSVKGTNITAGVAWSVAPAGQGVSIAEDGKITVAAKAKAGSYTVTATPVTDKSQGEAKFTTLTVGRATAEAVSIALSGGAVIMEIPTGENVTTTYTAEVKDQYGDVMTSPSVTWTIAPTVTGVSIANGVVTVTKDAKDAIAESQDFTITATAAEGVTDVATLTVKRSTAVAETVTVTPATPNVAVPNESYTSTITVTATVKDQYGADFTGDVTWSLPGNPEGVTIDHNGVVTITAAAAKIATVAGAPVTVTATCGEVSGSATLSVIRAAAKATSITISGPASAVIPTTGSSDNTYTYTATVKDQYGLEMPDATVTLSMSSSDDKVVFNAGTLTVKPGAKVNDYTLTAQCGEATQAMTIKVVNKQDANVTISGKPETVTYGDGDFTLTAAAASQNATVGSWSWSSSNADVLAVDNGKVTVKAAGTATITATYEDATYYGTASAEITVAPKALTVTGLAVDSKSYDGTTAAHLKTENARLEGVVPGDIVTLDSVGMPGVDFTDENAGVDKPVTFVGSFELTGADKGNYTLTQPTGLTGTITAATLTVTGATAQNRDYDGTTAVQINSVTFQGVASGESLAIGTDYTATGVLADGPDAGNNKTVNVTVTLLNSNYTLGENTTTTATVIIWKATWTGDHGVPGAFARKYGSTFYIDLSGFPDATQYIVPPSYLATFTAELDQKRVKVELGGADKIDSSGQVPIQVEMKNYATRVLNIMFTVLDKDTQTLTADPVEKVYGDVFTVSVNGAQTPVTYAVKPGSEDYLTYADGKFTAKKVGTATIVATAAENDDYKSNSVEIPVTIEKRTLTVTAVDQSAFIGGTVPTPTYTVSGFVFGDSWVTEPTIAYGSAVNMTKVGEYAIVLTGGDAGDNYTVQLVNGKLSVVNKSLVVPVYGNAINVNSTTNGLVNASTSTAPAGQTVVISTIPNQGYELHQLVVTDRMGSALPLTDLGNGRFSFVMPATSVNVTASFAKAQQSSTAYYPDVQPGDWYYDAVQYVTELGLMGGTGKGFEPSLTTSRAMIWTILARLDGVDTTVTSGDWYAVARKWAMENGVSDGTDPNGLITREQLAAMLYRYAQRNGVDVSVGENTNILSYTDALSISDWAFSAMQWACGAGVVNGINGGLLPQGGATRAQTATMLMRYLEQVK